MKRQRESSIAAGVIEVSAQPPPAQRPANAGIPISSIPFAVSSRVIPVSGIQDTIHLNTLFQNNTFNSSLLNNPDSTLKLRTLRAILSAPHLSLHQIDQLVDHLLSFIFTEPDKEMITMAIFILGNLSLVPSSPTPCMRIVESLLKLYAETTSKKLRITIIQSLKSISNTRSPRIASIGSDLRAKLIEMAQIHLLTYHPTTRRSSIEVLANCSPLDSNILLSWLFETLSRFFDDPDPRVRTSAFQGILTLHQRGARIDATRPENVGSLYRSAVAALEDDYDDVRIAAVRAIWVVSALHQNTILPSTGNAEPRRLIDDAFAKVSNSVMDGSVGVRTIACRLLGSMRGVSLVFLLQTLSKEELSRGQARLLIAHSKANDTNPGGGPPEAEGDISVLMYETLNDMGAATPGCFINALEDEYMEVRMAAVDSLCELAVRIISPLDQAPQSSVNNNNSNLSFRLSPSLFSRHAMDFLVDMFNDEIEGVRVNAIHSVRKIGVGLGLKRDENQSPLREEQLNVVLGVLEDSAGEVRAAVHRLLASIPLSNPTCLLATVQALLVNLNKYPQDQPSVFVSLRELGLSHSHFTVFLVTKLLHIDPRFIQIEPSCEDLAYVATMIVVLNSAKMSSTILSLIPSFCVHHYRYLKDKFPSSFPATLEDETTATLLDRGVTIHDGEVIVRRFVESALAQLTDIPWLIERGGLGFTEAERIVAQAYAAMKRVVLLEKGSARKGALYYNAKFYSMYFAALQLLIRVAKLRSSSSRVIVSARTTATKLQGSLLTEISRHMMNASYQMQHLHLGLNETIQRDLTIWRMFAHLVSIYSVIRDGDTPASSLTTRLIQRVTAFRRSTPDIPHQLEAILSDIESRPISTLPVIDGLLSRTIGYLTRNPIIITGNHRIRRVHAIISSPLTNSPDRPEEFQSGVSVARIPIDATVSDVHDPSAVSIVVDFTNGERLAYNLAPTDLTRIRPLQYRIKTILHLSISKAQMGKTSDSSLKNRPVTIAVSLGCSFRTDVAELDPEVTQPISIRGVSFAQDGSSDSGSVRICKPKKYHLLAMNCR